MVRCEVIIYFGAGPTGTRRAVTALLDLEEPFIDATNSVSMPHTVRGQFLETPVPEVMGLKELFRFWGNHVQIYFERTLAVRYDVRIGPDLQFVATRPPRRVQV